MVEEDPRSLEHDDDPWLGDEDCVSDGEHALEVVPEPVADAVPEPVAQAPPAVDQQDEQRRDIIERCLARRPVCGRGPRVTRPRFDRSASSRKIDTKRKPRTRIPAQLQTVLFYHVGQNDNIHEHIFRNIFFRSTSITGTSFCELIFFS